MRNFILIILTLSISLDAQADASNYISFFKSVGGELAKGFRLPTQKDMKDYWKDKESFTYKTLDGTGKHKAPYWTSGDFNGDKKIDYAYILISLKNNEKQLFAFLSSNNGYMARKLGESHSFEMGVATQEPGTIKTASGKGYWEPTPEDPPQVTATTQSIDYFMFESASSVFVWDKTSESFKRHWTSD